MNAQRTKMRLEEAGGWGVGGEGEGEEEEQSFFFSFPISLHGRFVSIWGEKRRTEGQKGRRCLVSWEWRNV